MTCSVPRAVSALLMCIVAGALLGCADDAVQPPSTDIYLASYTVVGDSIALAEPVNRTQRTGYDNQPQFTRDGRALLYTSERNGQTDIYRWPLQADAPHPLTRTATSEYSPTPLSDTAYAVVRVEDDGAQRLWQFPVDAERPAESGTLLLPTVAPVGYFAPVDTTGWALFVLGEPPTLQWVVGREDAPARTVRRDIGRSIQRRTLAPGISAVQRHAASDDSLLVIQGPGDVQAYAPALPGEGDHAWTPDGHLLMTSGTMLYQWHPAKEVWRAVYDWAPATPSRIAVSPRDQRIAIVVTQGDDEA